MVTKKSEQHEKLQPANAAAQIETDAVHVLIKASIWLDLTMGYVECELKNNRRQNKTNTNQSRKQM